MANRTWIGGATAVAQVDTITVGGTVEADDVFTLTVTAEDGSTYALDVVAGSTTPATVATTIATAWNASTNPKLTPITASTNSAAVILTADTSGVPFSVAATTTENGGGAADAQTFTRVATTANAGPNDWNTAANWREGSVPVAGDDVTIEGSNAITYGLRQSGVALGDFVVSPTYSGTIGSLGKPLDIDPDLFEFAGTGKAYIDLNAANISPRVTATASASTGAGLYLTGTNLATLRVEGGVVGVAVNAGETSTLATGQVSGSGKLTIGSGVTLTSFLQVAGTGVVECAATTVTADSGTLTTSGAGAITTLTNNGATVYASSSGTITDLHGKGGTTDLTKSKTPRTVSELHLYDGGKVLVDADVVTLTATTVHGLVTLTGT
jgi:hypothetical protein